MIQEHPNTHFHTFGYFEEISEVLTNKGIGCRCFINREPNVKFGADGKCEHLFKTGETITIDGAHKGPQAYTFKRDTLCWITTQALCGRMKERK